MKKKKGGLGGLYIIIALCFVVSGVAVFGLMGKLEGYQESNDNYANLQQAALSVRTTPVPGGLQADAAASQQPAQGEGENSTGNVQALRTISPQELQAAKEMAAAGEEDGSDVPVYDLTGMNVQVESSGPEGEEVYDEALIWMLKNQTEDELITDLPGTLLTPAPTWQEQPVNAAVPGDTAQTASVALQEPLQAADASTPGDPAQTVSAALQEPLQAADASTPGDPAQTASAAQQENAPVNAPTAQPEGVKQPEGALVAASTGGKAAPAEMQLSGRADNLQVTPKPTATPKPTPTLDSSTPTPGPTATPPPYVPSSGISMERAVTVPSAQLSVNFDYLTVVNEDVVGWIYQEGTPINYPVVRGDDNRYYLNHLFDHTVNSAGSVFMDFGNSAAFIDSATYLYGHHSKGGGMFATLSDYLDPAYYEAHPQLLLMTPFADYQVDVFAGMATIVEDEVSWRPKTLETEQDLKDFLGLILPQSFISAPEDKLPVWGDKLLVLVTCTNIQSNQRYVIYGRMRPIVYESTEEAVVATKVAMDQKPTQNGYVHIDGLGDFMYYAQNDELWDRMRYEAKGSGKFRIFGDGGCGPTAIAMAIANLCPPEELPRLIGYANTELGYTFCDCSVNRYYCDHTHAQYQLRTEEEFLRYMPLAVANFATGNNIWNIRGRKENPGTSMRYLDKIMAIYGTRVTVIDELEELIRRLREEEEDGIRRMVLTCAIKGSPFTNSGHYLLMCGLDDEYMYFLDPLRRDNYDAYDKKGYAEILQPGVCRIKLENLHRCDLTAYYLLEKVQ